jgi:hypothetical protein
VNDNDFQALYEQVFSIVVILLNILIIIHGKQVKSSIWIMDLGANICIINDKSLFTDFRTLEYKIGTTNDKNGIQVLGRGKMTLTLYIDREETANLNLTTIVYALSVRCNILLIS